MKTHEKTHQTMYFAFKLILLLTFLLFLTHCNNITSPTKATHLNEILFQEYAECYAKRLDIGEVKVFFHEEKRRTYCPKERAGEECYSACSAWPHSNEINCWSGWAREESKDKYLDLAFTAAHEVCHLSGIYREDDANVCASLIYGDCL